MLVYFSGATEYTHRFVEKLELPAVRIPTRIKDAQTFTVEEPYVLIVPTYELEDVHGSKGTSYLPRQVACFLNNTENRDKLRAVIGAGNRNFYTDFAKSADTISAKTGVPILYRVELSGTEDDVTIVKAGLNTFWEAIRSAKKAPVS